MAGMTRWWRGASVALLLVLVAGGGPLRGQAGQEIELAVGNSAVLSAGATLSNVAVGNPEIADVAVVSATEVVVNALSPGSTTVFLIEQGGGRTSYTIRVKLDVEFLQREFETLFPGEEIEVQAVGNTVILSGLVEDPRVRDKAVTLAQNLGENIQVLDNLSVPDPGQVLLQVRFAEVSRSWLREIGPTLVTRDGDNVDVTLPAPGENVSTGQQQQGGGAGVRPPVEVVSDAVNFFIFHDPSRVAAFIRALQTRGLFRSLAEPNLLAMPAESASFLAGGEFPFPVLQSAQQNNAVTIQFREFGVRLNFVPYITNSGSIRLDVAPEVSSLDFANGLTIAGFNIPSLLSRKAHTVIELEDGQTFAIAGLVDNSLVENISKVPLLGDIPILGELFKSREMRQNRSELLVLVTPRIVQPLDRAPPLPTGEPGTWRWDKSIRNPGETPAEDDGPP